MVLLNEHSKVIHENQVDIRPQGLLARNREIINVLTEGKG